MFSKDGIKLIDKVIGEFSKTVQKLKTGIKLCEEKKQGNEVRLKDIEVENSVLDTNISRANEVVANLEKLFKINTKEG